MTLYHLLKLFQTEAALASGKKNLVSEYYDEIVRERKNFVHLFLGKLMLDIYFVFKIFQDPTQMMHQCLLSARQLPFSKQDTDCEFRIQILELKFAHDKLNNGIVCFLGAEKERRTQESIANAREKINHEISEIKERLKASKEAIQHFQKEIQKVEKEQDDLIPSTSTANAT